MQPWIGAGVRALVGGLVVLGAAACGGARAPGVARQPDPRAVGYLGADPDSTSVGYGKQATRDLTGAVGVIKEEDIDNQRVTRVEELIQGRVAGVEVIRTSNGEYSIRIRGANSFLGGSEPLVVLDGMPVRGSLGSALASIMPQDVARIEVLKDAGTLASYGSQGANGVILITTRRRE